MVLPQGDLRCRVLVLADRKRSRVEDIAPDGKDMDLQRILVDPDSEMPLLRIFCKAAIECGSPKNLHDRIQAEHQGGESEFIAEVAALLRQDYSWNQVLNIEREVSDDFRHLFSLWVERARYIIEEGL